MIYWTDFEVKPVLGTSSILAEATAEAAMTASLESRNTGDPEVSVMEDTKRENQETGRRMTPEAINEQTGRFVRWRAEIEQARMARFENARKLLALSQGTQDEFLRSSAQSDSSLVDERGAPEGDPSDDRQGSRLESPEDSKGRRGA